MTDAPAPFDRLAFTVAKPGWGTSSLVATLAAPDAYELRTKRIEGGSAVADDVRPYSLAEAASLDRWIRALGFHDDASNERIEGAGTWSLKMAFRDASGTAADLEQGGTAYPAAFPDLLATMIGLGLPGFEHTDADAFLADFTAPRSAGGASPARSGAFGAAGAPGAAGFPGLEGLSGLSGLSGASGIPGIEGLLADLAKNPAQAEAALRDQCRQLPASTKRELLDFVRKNDPEHYDWWKRLLG